MMRLGGTNLVITDDNKTVCTDGDQRIVQDIKKNALRPDGCEHDFVPNIEQAGKI